MVNKELMPKLRPIKSSDLIRILTRHYGYVYLGTKGSHAHFKDGSGHKTTIPIYYELYPKIIKLVLEDTNLSWDDLEKYL